MPTPTMKRVAADVQKPDLKKEPEAYRALLKDAGAFVLVFDLHPTLGPLVNFGPLVRFAHEGKGFLRRMFGEEAQPIEPKAMPEPKPIAVRRTGTSRPRPVRRTPVRKAA
jgi:hypothetical protein